MAYLPLTPGLLISMAIRLDHSFGLAPFDRDQLDAFGKLEADEDEAKLTAKQIKLLREVREHYDRVASHKTFISKYDRGTFNQLCEEMTGHGFYRPDREVMYQCTYNCTDQALKEAVNLANNNVTFGPKFVIEKDDENPA